MINALNHRDVDMAAQILAVQLPAYRVEAELIGFDGIPPLRDTAESIMGSEEQFVGFMRGGGLAGFISYELQEDAVDICRLVVDPSCFRQGIARKLLTHVLQGVGERKKVTVSTGTKNEPAKVLYRSFGFAWKKEIEVAPGVSITEFELPKERE